MRAVLSRLISARAPAAVQHHATPALRSLAYSFGGGPISLATNTCKASCRARDAFLRELQISLQVPCAGWGSSAGDERVVGRCGWVGVAAHPDRHPHERKGHPPPRIADDRQIPALLLALPERVHCGSGSTVTKGYP